MFFIKDEFPPTISGPATLTVEHGQTYSFQIVASSNSSSSLRYSFEANGTTLEVDPLTGNVTWFVNSTDFRIRFIVMDSNNNTAMLAPTVRLCYCLNGGACNASVENTKYDQLNNLLSFGECSCMAGFTDAFCQTSVSYCLEDPCFEGVNCTDNATTQHADCDPCPTGYEGDGRKCFGMSLHILFEF